MGVRVEWSGSGKGSGGLPGQGRIFGPGLLDEDRQEEVYDYFMMAQTDNIAVALKELGTDEYTEEDLRLMRIKFLSEVAN